MQTSIVDPPFFAEDRVLTEKLYEFPPQVGQLPVLFSAIEQYITANELTAVNLNNLKLLSEEIFVNIANYSTTDTNCYFFIGHNEQNIFLKFIDHGIPFNPLEKPPVPKTDEIQIGGLGLVMIRKLSKDLSYSRLNGFNFLLVKFQI